MIFLITILSVVFLISFWVGYLQKLRLDKLSKRLIGNSLLGLFLILTIMTAAYHLEVLPWIYATYITMGFYCIATGFFAGSGYKLVIINKQAGHLLYTYQSFWTRIVPNIIALLIVAFGFYKTGLLEWSFSNLKLTSGLSLMGFGFWGWTINMVPQFRSQKILLLDQSINWESVTSYGWQSENVLQIDYRNNKGGLTDFTTFIPPEDQLQIERILSNKMEEKEERQEDSA